MNARLSGAISVCSRACLFCRADCCNLFSTALSPTPKYYAVDPGLRNSQVSFVSKNLGRVLENIVNPEFIHLGYRAVVCQYDAKRSISLPSGRACLGYYDETTRARELVLLRVIRDSFTKAIILYDSA